MNATITKQFRFEASHRLPHHNGKCHRPHGHSYIVEVAVHGWISEVDGTSDHGMVMDFADISRVWKDQLEPMLDHRDLNESLAGEIPVTTAEQIAGWLYRMFDLNLKSITAQLDSVTVWETATSRATVSRDSR